MAEVQVFDAGSLNETSPAAILADALAMGFYGCLTFSDAENRHPLYLTGGTLAGTGGPIQAVLGAALVVEQGQYELSSALPDSFSMHDPWRALQAATMQILGKPRMTMLARTLRHVRIEPAASPLQAWVNGIPDAMETLAEVGNRVFGAVENLRMRTLVNLVLLREMGLVAWPGAPLGHRPLLWRPVEPQAGDSLPAHARPAPPASESAAPNEPSAESVEIEITMDDSELQDAESVFEAPAAPPAEPAQSPAPSAQAGALLDGSAFDEGLMFLRQGSLGAAKYRFEDHLQFRPDDLEAAAYVTWIDLHEDLGDESARAAALGALDLALKRKRTADLLTFKAGVLRLEGQYGESVTCLDEALRLDPRHANARFERDQVRRRLRSAKWPDVNVEDVRIDAAIILQRRIGSQVKIYSFKQTEIRVGSSDNDDVVVSEAVLPQVARRHCTVTCREGRIWVRRNASLGRVFVNDRELEIRKDVPLGAADCVRLGEGAPCLEFRAFGFNHLHDVSVLATGGIR